MVTNYYYFFWGGGAFAYVEIDYLAPSLFALAFRNELQHCYANVRINSGDDAAAS